MKCVYETLNGLEIGQCNLPIGIKVYGPASQEACELYIKNNS